MKVYLVTLGNWTHDANVVFSVWDSRDAAVVEAQRMHDREVESQGHHTRGPEVVELEINSPHSEPVN